MIFGQDRPQTADPAEYVAVIRNVNTPARRAALPALTSARVDTIEISVAPSGMGLGRLLTSRGLLWVGLGGLLAIVLLMAWEGSRVVGVIEGEGNRLRATYQ